MEANVIISGGDQHDDSSTPLNDVWVDSATNENGSGEKARMTDHCINDEGVEAETFIVDLNVDESNETQIDFSFNEQDESQYLLRKERPCANLKKNYGTLKHNETLNKFLQDIHDKEIALSLRFSDQEINDIHDAVEKFVNKLAQKVGNVDSRLEIAEVILLGSLRERSQIVRPCEYDFALILEHLSHPDVVFIQPADPNDSSREYVHVNLKGSHIKSAFCDFLDGKDIYYAAIGCHGFGEA